MKKVFIVLAIFLASSFLLRPPVSGGRVTSLWGIRFMEGYAFHTGTDFALPVGSPVNSTSWGTVKSAGYHELAGNNIIISHLPGIDSRYQHLQEIFVTPGKE